MFCCPQTNRILGDPGQWTPGPNKSKNKCYCVKSNKSFKHLLLVYQYIKWNYSHPTSMITLIFLVTLGLEYSQRCTKTISQAVDFISERSWEIYQVQRVLCLLLKTVWSGECFLQSSLSFLTSWPITLSFITSFPLNSTQRSKPAPNTHKAIDIAGRVCG